MRTVLCFGEVLWDLFEISPDVYRREIGGAPANVAVVLARLGIASRLCGAVGTDRFGTELCARIAQTGVDVSAVARRKERTGLTFVARDDAGEPTFLFYRHDSADMTHAPGEVPDDIARGCSFAVLGTSTFVPGPVQATSERVLAAIGAEKSCALVVDLNVRAHLWADKQALVSVAKRLLRDATYVKASSADLAALMAIDGRSETAWLAEAPGATWFVTRGGAREGASIVVGGAVVATVPTEPAVAVDATGAGDAFLSGVLATLAASEVPDFVAACAFGHRVAAAVIQGLGGTSALDDPAVVARLRAT
jgi:fructokinase